MAVGITGKEPDPKIVYADIIDLPHHVSKKHPQMSLYDRAAQFSPFSALSGYDEMVAEESRQTERKIELGEEELEALNTSLRIIANGGVATITYFIPDPLKAGGRYETLREKVRRVDTARQMLILEKKVGLGGSYMEIPIGDILEINTAS